MEEAKGSAQQQQHQHLILQQQQQQQQQQSLLLLQQLQRQRQQAAAMSRFPSNIDAHLRPPGLVQRLAQQNQNLVAESAPSTLQQQLLQQQKQLQQQLQHQKQQQQQQQQQQTQQQQQQQQQQTQQQQHQQQTQQQQQQQTQQQHQQQKAIRPENRMELQMAYQDAWRVCHPDLKRPFSSLEDACERLLPYHVVADYEAEEDDRILDSDATGQVLSRSQQWDHNIAAKVAEFTSTFEKQVLAFDIINRKRRTGEFRSEERLMIEQALLQEEKRALLHLKAAIEPRDGVRRDAHEAQVQKSGMQMEHPRFESQQGPPIRASVRRLQGSDIPLNQGFEEQEKNPEEMMNGWANNAQRDEKEPSEDFLNDEETDNGDTVGQDDWREAGKLDLNAR